MSQQIRKRSRLCFEIGDGRELSFDSLVYAESAILEGYAAELARVLNPSAVAFLHHSNPVERPIWYKLKHRLTGATFRACIRDVFALRSRGAEAVAALSVCGSSFHAR